MAQLGATEPQRRHVVLYVPYLKWIATALDSYIPPATHRANNPRAERFPLPDWLAAFLRDRTRPERERWIACAVLAHEIFHIFNIEVVFAKDGGADKSHEAHIPLDYRGLEVAADRFSDRLLQRFLRASPCGG
jgi:hypothetical protein